MENDGIGMVDSVGHSMLTLCFTQAHGTNPILVAMSHMEEALPPWGSARENVGLNSGYWPPFSRDLGIKSRMSLKCKARADGEGQSIVTLTHVADVRCNGCTSSRSNMLEAGLLVSTTDFSTDAPRAQAGACCQFIEPHRYLRARLLRQ
jgi:hypothetical protein